MFEIETYKETLNSVIKQLTQKRTELNDLANQTVENLRIEIPQLRDQVELLKREITRLDENIFHRKQELNKERDGHREHYKNLENLLKEEYTNRKKELDAIEKKQSLMIEQYNIESSKLKSKEEKLIIDRESLDNLQKAFKKFEEEFEIKKNLELKEISSMKKEISENLENNRINSNVIEARVKELTVQSGVLNTKIKEADETIKKISEADVILCKAKEKEEINIKREEKLNELNVKLLAETKQNFIRTENLDKREKALNDRENNIKLLEVNLISES